MSRYSIHSWFGFPISMEDRFTLIKSAGFDGILLWWSDEYAEVDGDKSLHPELARRQGLFIENIHTPFKDVNYLWLDRAEGDDLEKILINCILECSEHEIPTAVVHLSKGDNPPPVNQIGLDRIKRIVEIAERKNVNIALENLRKPEYLDFIFANIQSDRLGFCYDSGHENCFTKGTDFLTQYGSKLMALHLHDNDGTDDQHQIPGEGTIDWSVVTKKIKEAGYTGTIALEVTKEGSVCHSNASPERFLSRAFEVAKELADWKSLERVGT